MAVCKYLYIGLKQRGLCQFVSTWCVSLKQRRLCQFVSTWCVSLKQRGTMAVCKYLVCHFKTKGGYVRQFVGTWCVSLKGED